MRLGEDYESVRMRHTPFTSISTKPIIIQSGPAIILATIHHTKHKCMVPRLT